MRYAVIKRWKDNEKDFQVIEYFSTKEECDEFIKRQKKSPLYRFEIGFYS